MIIEREINPLPYMFLMVILAGITFDIFSRYKWLAILIAGCFFVLIYLKSGYIFTIIMFMFFIVGIINNTYYYNFTPIENEKIRITTIKEYGASGEIRGRKVYLNGYIKGEKIGNFILASGNFEEKKELYKGIIGVYKINSYEKLNGDFTTKLYRIRENIFYKIKDKLGWRRASLVTSIAFGYTDFLDSGDKSEMKNLGVLHAISVSGMHMVLVYMILRKIFGLKVAPFIAFIYVLFTGASLPAIRAYIMLLCMSLSTPLKRNYNPLAALSLSGSILAVINPYSIFDVGFQLTYCATLGIIIFNKKINKGLFRLPKYLRESIAICISAQIFTFPVLISYFKEFSLAFILGNLLISPLISMIVVLGNILALTIYIPVLFNYICYVTHYVTVGIDIITEFLLNISPPIAYVNENIGILYLSILTTVYFYKKGYKKFIYIPYITMVYIMLVIYSPLVKIQYYKEGAIVLSYRGERAIIQLKTDVDIKRLQRIAITNKVYKEFSKIYIGNGLNLIKEGKVLILDTKENDYLIKIAQEKKNNDYDIIDFKEGTFDKVLIINNKVIKLD